MSRKASISRNTKETSISLSINLDGTGESIIQTGVGFFDHMLEQIAKHGLIDIELNCQGDNHIDDHHSVEDIGIALGQAIKEAVGDKRGIARFGSAYVPLDEALARVVVDFSGRSCLQYNVSLPTQKIGAFDSELILEFFTALTHNAQITLHIDKIRGINSHHIAESVFKSFAVALRTAIKLDSRRLNSIPSSKGVL